MEIAITPFVWDGTSNIVVAVDENTATYGNDPGWYQHSVTVDRRGIFYRSDATNPDPATPPAAQFTTLNVAQIQFEFLTPSCSGTPTAGTTVLTPTSGNVSTAVNGSVTGSSDDETGLTFQWEYSDDNGTSWNNISGQTSKTLTTTAKSTLGTRQYRRAITCSGATSYSTPETFTTLNLITYCTPSGTSSTKFISDFSTTGGVQNISNLTSGRSANSYGDFYSTKTVSQIAGSTFNFSASIAGGTSGFRIWIDWNSDGSFTEVAYVSNSYLSIHTGTITIPLSQVAGNYRMRIISDWSLDNAPRSPCLTNYDQGEFEDYKVIVIDVNTACAGTPDAGVTVINPNSGGFSTTVNGSASGATTGGGLTYQWQYSDDGSTWIDITGQTSITLTTPAKNVAGTRQYRRKITCTNSGVSATSTPATYTTTDIGKPICDDMDAFCSTTSYNFSNVTTGVAPTGPEYGCLGSRPSPFFYYLKIGSTGSIQLSLKQFNLANQPKDVDFALWGPFISIESGCNQIMAGQAAPIQCSYDITPVETIGLGMAGGSNGGGHMGASTPPAAQAGEFYILILTNFSGEAGYITLNQAAGTGATDCSITPLPVTLTSLSATCNDGVTIHWTTASEKNADRFIVEKSRDGQTWVAVGETKAAGNSNSIINYSQVDKNNWSGVAYYRLKQVDFNGNQEIFGPISVSCDANENNMSVYPNPSKSDFTVEISSTEKFTNGQIQLIDLAGKIIINQSAIIGIGMNQFNFNHVDLEKGTYFVKFTGGNSSFKPVKLVIQ